MKIQLFKRINWSDFDFGFLSQSSVSKYKGVMMYYNTLLSNETDCDTYLYWHIFINPENHQKIVDNLKTRYNAKTVPIYITIIVKCLSKIPSFPAASLAVWHSILDQEKHIADSVVNDDKNIKPWHELSNHLQHIISTSKNNNIIIISHLYINGYVLRPDEITQTKYKNYDPSDIKHNFLDLDNCVFLINEEASKTFSRKFILPKSLCDIIKLHTNPSSDYLLSRINGQPYVDWGSFNTTWKKSVGFVAYDFRKSFDTWYNNRYDTDVDKLSKFAFILGHSIKTNLLHYTLNHDPSQPLDFIPAVFITLDN